MNLLRLTIAIYKVNRYLLGVTGVMLLVLSVLVQSGDKTPPPAPPPDDSLSGFCPPNRVAFCQSFCAHNPVPTCFASCCGS